MRTLCNRRRLSQEHAGRRGRTRTGGRRSPRTAAEESASRRALRDWASPKTTSIANHSPLGDGPVRQFDQLRAAAAHLNGDFPQRSALELDPRGLPMVRANHIAELALGSLLELLYLVRSGLEHEIILAQGCFFSWRCGKMNISAPQL